MLKIVYVYVIHKYMISINKTNFFLSTFSCTEKIIQESNELIRHTIFNVITKKMCTRIDVKNVR